MIRLAVLFAGCFLFAAPCRGSEPIPTSSEREKLDACLRRLDSEDPDERAYAAHDLGQLASEMVAEMQAETLQTGRLTPRDQPSCLRRWVEKTRASLAALRTALRDRRALVRAEAATALAEVANAFHLATGAAPSRLELWRELCEEMSRQLRDAVPDLLDGLRDASLEVQEKVVQALGAIGPEATDALPALLQATRHSDHRVRQTAAEAVRRISRGK